MNATGVVLIVVVVEAETSMMDIVFIGLQVHASFSVYCTCN